MRGWFETIVGPELAGPVSWTAAIVLVGLLLFAFYRIARRYSSGTYVAGGRNRKARLAIVDATAVDGHRRLVLVRRDDVEHLVMIGGPSDVVIEQHIRVVPRPARSLPEAEQAPPPPKSTADPATPRAAPAISPVPEPPGAASTRSEAGAGGAAPAQHRPPAADPAPAARPQWQAQREAPAAPHPVPAGPDMPRPERVQLAPMRAATLPPLRSETEATTTARASGGTTAPPLRVAPLPPAAERPEPAPANDVPEVGSVATTATSDSEPEFDAALMHELEETLDLAAGRNGEDDRPREEVEDEMARLLGSLSPDRR
ncbi:MAG: flagellar biosynthetic protein FliO [Rhizobiaceae bacterium]|nr:flagellar biosynthetic protein FliO [Rhizobiaceae bacterium]MCV0407039.1 flagellar biosynthetic protein FliO [Rhizobiaceae bacterium]